MMSLPRRKTFSHLSCFVAENRLIPPICCHDAQVYHKKPCVVTPQKHGNRGRGGPRTLLPRFLTEVSYFLGKMKVCRHTSDIFVAKTARGLMDTNHQSHYRPEIIRGNKIHIYIVWHSNDSSVIPYHCHSDGFPVILMISMSFPTTVILSVSEESV